MTGENQGDEMRVCKRCRLSKPLSAFGVSNAYVSGRESRCKECCAAYARERYHKRTKSVNKLDYDIEGRLSRDCYGFFVDGRANEIAKRNSFAMRRLASAIMVNAVSDAVGWTGNNPLPDLQWIFDPHYPTPLSFSTCCEILGKDPLYARERIIRFINNRAGVSVDRLMREAA